MAKIERKKEKKVSKAAKAKSIFLTGTSHMIPVLVVAGFLQAIAKAIGGYDVASNPEMVGTFAYNLARLGAGAMVLTIPVLSAAIAWAIGDKPAIAPGLAVGYLSSQVISSGFVGGVIGGVACGMMVFYLKKLKVPSWFAGPMNLIVVPLSTSFAVGMLLFYVVGTPIAWGMDVMKGWLTSLQGSSRFVFGAIMGLFWGIDFGGPFTQTAASVANALNAEGVFAPSAVKMAAGMAPPISMAVATFLQKRKFKKADVENAKVGVVLGCFYITEGALPFFLNDPVRVWMSTIPGCALGGGLSMLFGVESPALHGGIFAIPLMNKPLMFLLALGCNILLSSVIYAIIKKPLPVSEQDFSKKQLSQEGC
ncbi:MAG: PTS fructose transporter subunit IIC [Lachnospiraceae bacterium]|nr:PTS fructose transporter subunit IIC [Lachnospiraceae bacterium]